MIISRTPFRMSFFGGGTDFPGYYLEHGGAVLSTSINQFCYISIHRLQPFFKYRFRVSYAQTELIQDASEIQHPLVRECLLLTGQTSGLEIIHFADLPGRTGLGSSSSFTVGLLHALMAQEAPEVDPGELARLSIVVERERVGDTGGHQDQYAAAFGGFRRIDFGKDGNVNPVAVPITLDVRNELQNNLLMFYTGMEQSAESILRTQSSRIGTNIATLHEMKDMVAEAVGLLEAGRVEDFGRLLHQAWERKKSLSAGITTPIIDHAYETARQHGALGGKLLGAGGRGFLLVFCPPEKQAGVREALQDLREVPMGFSEEGSRIIFRDEIS